jgi:hypothetical protein
MGARIRAIRGPSFLVRSDFCARKLIAMWTPVNTVVASALDHLSLPDRHRLIRLTTTGLPAAEVRQASGGARLFGVCQPRKRPG